MHAHSCPTPRTVACQAPLSMEFPRQEYWSRSAISYLQGIFLTWGSNLCLSRLLHYRQILNHWATCDSWGHRVGHDWATELNWTEPRGKPKGIFKWFLCFQNISSTEVHSQLLSQSPLNQITQVTMQPWWGLKRDCLCLTLWDQNYSDNFYTNSTAIANIIYCQQPWVIIAIKTYILISQIEETTVFHLELKDSISERYWNLLFFK